MKCKERSNGQSLSTHFIREREGGVDNLEGQEIIFRAGE
jgi:hypothetical protein